MYLVAKNDYTNMKWLQISLTVLLVYCATTGNSNTAGYSISCSSEFTPVAGSFCVGIPLQCTVQLSNVDCVALRGPVLLQASDIALQVRGTGIEATAPDFAISQNGFVLTVTIDHYPRSIPSSLRVEMESIHVECLFSVDTNNVAVSSPSQCSNPTDLTLTHTHPSLPGNVEGGDIVSVDLELTASTSMIQSPVITLGNYHPALLLLSNVSFTSTDASVETQSYDSDIHDTSSGNFEPIVFFNHLSSSETISISLSFQVLPFVLPKANLYFSFHVFYYVSSFAEAYTFQTSTSQSRGLSTSSPYVGNYTLILPHYNDSDRVDDAFPPHENDIFMLEIPIVFPCVMTEMSITITIPEFLSEFYTFFFTDVDSVDIDTPSNFFSVQSLCDYRVLDSFNADTCYTNRLANSDSPQVDLAFAENTGMGVDTVTVTFGSVWRSVTVGEDCAGNDPDASCSCQSQASNITLTGTVLTKIPCKNQTLADNVTVELSYISDVNTWTSNNVDISNDAPEITRESSVNSTLFAINASSPAISLPISSHEGDAGDAFNITFGVLHDGEYSSFTAYHLNYTFSIDPRLVPEENITICLFNTSSEPYFCEMVPFVNFTIVRYGYHDV